MQARQQHEQVAKAHHQFGALRDVLHGVDLQRMHRPQQRNGECQRFGHSVETAGKEIEP